jgi:CBS domain-containing protein
MNVRDVMTRDAKGCSPDTSLESVAMMMWDHNCGSIPVVDPTGTPIGLITDRDIAMSAALGHKPLWELTARDVLNGRAVYTCRADDNLKAALKTMWAQHIRRIPVVDAGGHLAGILSVDDIVSHAERGSRGQMPPELSFDDAVATLKSVVYHH